MSNICWKSKHEKQNGKKQLKKQMNGQCGDGQMQK